MAEHPAALLRRASARLREATGEATPGPWHVAFLDGVAPLVDGPGHMVAKMHRCGHPGHEGRAKADASLTALLRNSAEALAGWLELEAERARKEIRVPFVRSPELRCRTCDGTPDVPGGCECWDAALATARAILGEEDSAATAAGSEES